MSDPEPESPSQRIYREAEKPQFFEAFERLGRGSLASRELGIKAANGNRWLIKAAIDSKQKRRARRAEYFRLTMAAIEASRRELLRSSRSPSTAFRLESRPPVTTNLFRSRRK